MLLFIELQNFPEKAAEETQNEGIGARNRLARAMCKVPGDGSRQRRAKDTNRSQQEIVALFFWSPPSPPLESLQVLHGHRPHRRPPRTFPRATALPIPARTNIDVHQSITTLERPHQPDRHPP